MNDKKTSINNIDKSNNFDERFIKAYIGNNADIIYDSIKNEKISILGILFGIGYYAYRKMYLIAVIIAIFAGILNYFIPSVAIYFNVFIGFAFCAFYKWDITRKLRKIKKENPTANDNQLLEIAKNKGGTSIVGAILSITILILIIIFI